ncbi:hypothetical protein TeGR_g14014 [Tetraparma gracilis]|uniref:Ribosome recycling factor domain-containing protein n=1 Tax=Tetraparma gracilis TaxID=2962635 RepID=A0ABQ6N2U7_9STRA|nr:hypothetical protein TeGR_g14014 [Tetraparma gracilis]
MLLSTRPLGRLLRSPPPLSLFAPASSSFHSSALNLGGKKTKRRRDEPSLRALTLDKAADRRDQRVRDQTKAQPYTAPISNSTKKQGEGLFKYASVDAEPSVFFGGADDADDDASDDASSYDDDDDDVESADISAFRSALESASKKRASGNNRGSSVRQQRFESAITKALIEILESRSFPAGGALVYGEDPIEILDTKVSSDLRHATIMYALPSTVPLDEAHEASRVFKRQIEKTGVVRYITGELTRRVRSQFAFRLRFVEGQDKEVEGMLIEGYGGGGKEDVGEQGERMDGLFDSLEEEIDAFERRHGDV